MKQVDVLRVGQLLLAEAALLGADRWPQDVQAFAVAVDKVRARNPENRLAASFHLTDGPTGRHSYEFREMLTQLHVAGLISYDSVDNTYCRIRISAGGAHRILQRNPHTDTERKEAQAILLAHWEEVIGSPWKQETPEERAEKILWQGAADNFDDLARRQDWLTQQLAAVNARIEARWGKG